MISAKIIADSIANNVRLTTMELNYPRFIHSEFMTHRMFSRNASSSRAIPIEKMLEQVQENPALPIHWGRNEPGMQAREEIGDLEACVRSWKTSALWAEVGVDSLKELGVHKQVVNRLLEPFQYIKVIVTATEWDNFFKLRLHPDAQPEIACLASKMQEAMDESNPTELEHGEWHLPYVKHPGSRGYEFPLEKNIKCSVARCARVSYLNHDASKPDVEKDIALYNRLLKDGHMSPLEHQLSPMKVPKDDYTFEKGVTHIDRYGWKWSGNMRGWYQHRHII